MKSISNSRVLCHLAIAALVSISGLACADGQTGGVSSKSPTTKNQTRTPNKVVNKTIASNTSTRIDNVTHVAAIDSLNPRETSASESTATPPAAASETRPVSFITAPANSTVQQQERLQDTQGQSSFVRDMPKYVDLNCSVKFIDDIRLPAKETGVIKSLPVKEGDFVAAGKTVGQIDDEMYQQMYTQAEMRYKMALDVAQDETAKSAAEKKYKVAGIEAKKTLRLWQSGSRSDSELQMAQYSADIAGLEIQKAELEMRRANMEASLEMSKMTEVKTRIERHTLKTDFDAYVIEIFKKPQEFVNVGEEVMRIARMDKLWVQGILDIQDLNPHEALNRPVTVTVDLARGETTTFQGKIVNVALERQSSQHYMVKAEVENRPVAGHWILQPFSEVRMRIHLDGPVEKVGNTSQAKR